MRAPHAAPLRVALPDFIDVDFEEDDLAARFAHAKAVKNVSLIYRQNQAKQEYAKWALR